MKLFFHHPVISSLLLVFMIVVAALVVFPPEVLVLKWSANYAVQIMFGYLFAGLLFLGLERRRLMLTAFVCCAVLCLFLKSASNSEMAPPPPAKDAPRFSVSHFNVNNPSGDMEEFFTGIETINADLVNIQEITPVWEDTIIKRLSPSYPYYYSNAELGLFGMAVFSKYPFSNIDTFRYKEIPHLFGTLALNDEHKVRFISIHPFPALNNYYYERLKEHLGYVAQYCKEIVDPLIVLGDYHAVIWSDEVQDFRQSTRLNDSRRGLMPTFPHGSLTFHEQPIDHIFYSKELDCLEFKTISSHQTTHLGIVGQFQFKPVKTDSLLLGHETAH